MRRTTLILSATFVTALLVAGYFLLRGSEDGVALASADRGGSGPEMSSERIRWEWERLRDPATGLIPNDIRSREIAFAASHPVRNRAYAKSAGVAAYSWSHRGPWNIGGRTRAVAIDVTGEDTILAGGVSGGMWRSSDRGATWKIVTDPDQMPSVTTIAQDRRPGKEHIWYFGSGELYGNSASGGGAFYFGNGIYKSTDNGRSWRSLQATAGSPTALNVRANIWRLATDPTESEEDHIYAAVYGRIMRSIDGGESWTFLLSPSISGSSSYFTDIEVTSQGVVFATLSSDGTKEGIYRSVDGENFTEITPPDMPDLYRRIVIGPSTSNPNVTYFLSETPGTGHLGRNFRGDSSWHSLWKYTYVSGDGTGDGGIWENRSENLPSFDWGGGNGDLYSQGSYDLHVRVKPDDEDVVFIGGTNLYRSTDGFTSTANTSWIGGFRAWERDSSVVEEYSYPEHHADQHDVIFSPTDPDIMYSASDGGVHRTFDALADSVSWSSLNSGYLTSQFYTVAIDHGSPGDETIVGGLQDNGTWRTSTSDPRVPWVRTGSSDGAYCAIADGGDHMYVSKQLGRIYRVDLDGGEVVSSARIDPEGATGYRFINPFILDPADSKVMYLPIGNRFYRNLDVAAIPTGSNLPTSIGWEEIDGGFVDRENAEITAIAASSSSHRVYYGTNDSYIYRMDNATGQNPTAIDVSSRAVFPNGAFVSSIAVDPEDPDHVVFCVSNYGVNSIFRSTDAGETWNSISGNLEERVGGGGNGPSVRTVAILPRGGRTVYLAGTSTGLYSTVLLDGNNTTWVKESPELIGNVVVDMIAARAADGFVAVGTHGNGVYSATIGLLGVEETVRNNAATLTLSAPTPNPVRARTRIDYVVPAGADGRGALTLYNTSGRVVYRRDLGTVTEGRRSLEIDLGGITGGLPAATYFYRVTVGEKNGVGRLDVVGDR